MRSCELGSERPRGVSCKKWRHAEPFHLPLVDLTDLPLAEREAESQRRVVAESQQPFDLATGPLFRVLLFRLTPVEHQLMVVIHHIATDAWSARLLLRELITLYRAYLAGEPSSLADPSIQYRDYSRWQHEQTRGEAFGRDLAFWKGRLKDMPPLVELPTLRAGPETQDERSSGFPLNIGRFDRGTRRAWARGAGDPLHEPTGGLQSFTVAVYGPDRFGVGVPVAGRTRVEFEDALGCFTNTLVLRTDLSGEPSFREVLRRVRAVTVGGYSHQDFPVRATGGRAPAGAEHTPSPALSGHVQLPGFSGWTSESDGLGIEEVEVPRNHALVDLALRIVRRNSRLSAQMVCNPRFFDAGTAERLVEHYRLMLQGVTSNPERKVSSLPLLTPAERRQQLVEWNAHGLASTRSSCGVHQLVEAQVARTPEAPAVVCGDAVLTYAELNARANQVAAALRARGVGPGAYVPLLMPGGIEVAIGMLAVMKAGAAFVPLDLDWPVERIRGALSQLPPGVALVGPNLPFSAVLLQRPVLIVNPAAGGDVAAPDFEPTPEIAASAEVPIYAIFTSGSTGIPKAAVVPHRGITNRLLWMNEFFGPATAAAVLQTTRHVYDSAVWQLLWPLINGGKTVMPGPEAEGSAETVAQLIERHQVTITDFVPSVFNALVPQMVAAAPLRQQLRSLRAIIVGGEEITPATTYQFMAAFPDVRVINLYGPTEASIGCICYEVTGSEGDAIPIGRPIANVRVLVLDPDRNPVPVGVAGELYLGGTCVGLGYLNDPEKTRTSFVDSPCPELGRGKLYRTGDRVRYRPDGQLEFLGRLDRQVKLRGLRIELGEIESALDRHPAVHESVVCCGRTVPATSAWWPTSFRAATLSPASAHCVTFCVGRLPEYMLPTVLVPLAELPRSPGGKVYRRALPRPDYASALDETAVEPRTPTEATIARIWAQVLHLDRVGVHANFFELGGHSLLATRLISRMRAELQVELPLRTLFEAPTVAGLAGEVARREEKAQADQALLLQELEGLSEEEAQQLLLGDPGEGHK